MGDKGAEAESLFNKEETLSNDTEKAYAKVSKLLLNINVRIPTGVIIMANIVGICDCLADGLSGGDIVKKYDLKIKETSFATTFKNTTGVSVSDIPSIGRFDPNRRRLVALGYDPEQIEEIMKAVG